MIEGLKYWGEEIFSNRHNSWPIAAIFYCLAVFVMRDFFLNPVCSQFRDLEKKERKEVKKIYLNRALLGWVLFVVSLGLFIFLWRRPSLYPVTRLNALLILGSLFFAGLFILFHLQALGMALLAVLKKATRPPENSDSL